MLFDWPAVLAPSSGSYAPAIVSLSGGQALSGFEQVQPQLADRWGAGFSFALRDRAPVLALRNLLTRLRGRANTVALPTFDRGRLASFGGTVVNPPFWQRWPNAAGTAYEFTPLAGITGTATILGATRFSFAATGTVPPPGCYVTLAGQYRRLDSVTGAGPSLCTFAPGLTVAGAPALVTAARLNAVAALNAVALDMAFTIGGPPDPGVLFGLGTRLYAIDSVTALGAGLYRFAIWPWLRAAAAAGTAVNFADPVCEMRLASDREGAEALASLQALRNADVTLRFDEASSL